MITANYSYLRSREELLDSGTRRETPLNPRHSAALDLGFEEDESGTSIALETFYTGRQPLDDNPYRSVSRPYVTLELLAQQRIGHATLFLNVENITNLRQTRFDPLLLPTPGLGGRRTTDEWAPLQGRTINGGVRLRF